MNDCFWCSIGVCEADNCEYCKKYLSMNSDEGYIMIEKYDKDVKEYLKPFKEKYKIIFNSLLI